MFTWQRRDAIYDDPMVDRILALPELPVDEQLNWISCARAKLAKTREKLYKSPTGKVLKTNLNYNEVGLMMIDLRLEWLDKLYDRILMDKCRSEDRSAQFREASRIDRDE